MTRLLCLFALVGCYKHPPPAPTQPTAPLGLRAFDRTLALPPPRMAELGEVSAVPSTLPLDPSQTVIIALPRTTNDNAEGTGLDPVQNALRIGLISAFLDAGYRVKDAGEVTVPTMTIESRPSGSAAVPSAAALPGSTEDWTGYQVEDGLHLTLNDPTSLWASELAEYPDLDARYFLRVFEIEVSEQTRGKAGRQIYTEAQKQSFEAQAAPVNAELDEWKTRRDAVLTAEIKYQEDHAIFKTACRAWEERYARQIRAKQIPPQCNDEPQVLSLPEVPEPLSRKTLQAHLRKMDSGSTNRVVGRLLAELIDTRTAEVVWVGRAEVEIDPGPDAMRRVFAKMLQKLRGA